MNLLNIKEGNILLAEFMGYIPDINNKGDVDDHWRLMGNHYLGDLPQYQEEWGELMPVVEKIESLGYFCNIYRKGVEIVHDGTAQLPGALINTLISSYENQNKLGNLWEACVTFVEQWNTKKYAEVIRPSRVVELDEDVVKLMILILSDVTEVYGNKHCNDFNLRKSFLCLIKKLGVEVQHMDNNDEVFTVFDSELAEKFERYLLKKETTP